MHIDPACDQVFIDGERISLVGYIYVMLNKPKGYLSANKDADHPTVIDLINQQITKDKSFYLKKIKAIFYFFLAKVI